MANLYRLVKDQQKEISKLKSEVASLKQDLELLKTLATLREKAEPAPFRKLGPYYDEPTPYRDDWWKNQPWMVIKPCRDIKDLGFQRAEIYFDEAVQSKVKTIKEDK